METNNTVIIKSATDSNHKIIKIVFDEFGNQVFGYKFKPTKNN